MKIYKLFVLNLFFVVVSCSSDLPPEIEKITSLKLYDVTSIEAWINVHTQNIEIPTKYLLNINNIFNKEITLYSNDTLIYIDSLTPSNDYTISLTNNKGQTNEIKFRTMDTTSHEFTYERWVFGEYGNNILRDAIINSEDDLWTTGEVYLFDSNLSKDYNYYGLLHYNNENWEILRPLAAINNYYSETVAGNSMTMDMYKNLLVCNGNVFRYSGSQVLDVYHLLKYSSSPNNIFDLTEAPRHIEYYENNIYVAGLQGSFAKFDGVSWKRINTHTKGNINDIFILKRDFMDVPEIYLPVSTYFQYSDRKILKYKNNEIDSIGWLKDYEISGIWGVNPYKLYASGDGVFEFTNGFWKYKSFGFYTNKIAGTNANNIIVCGDYGLFLHFNGISWQSYNYFPDHHFSSCTIKNKTAVLVGEYNNKAVVIKIKFM